MKRRNFIQGGLAGLAAGASLSPATGREARAAMRLPGGKPRRIIFLVSDGMSQAVPSMAENYARRHLKRESSMAALMRNPEVAAGLFETHSLSSLVTDSAAAATAWGAGSRVANGAINVLPGGRTLTPILPLLKDAGFATGLVTTARVTHATPAGFAAVQKSRGSEDDIATQYAGIVDIILGGGDRHYAPDSRRDGRDLYEDYRRQGYRVLRDRKALLAAPADAQPLLGTFSTSHVPYRIDRDHQPALAAKCPSLAEMTRAALQRLTHNPKGFLLQVEGARVDHAAHVNDAAGIVHEQLDFDEAIAVALEYRREHPDTLVVVTSDHGNSNPGLNGMGDNYSDAPEAFDRLSLARASFEEIQKSLASTRKANGKYTADTVGALLRQKLGLDFSTDEAQSVADAGNGLPIEELNLMHQNLAGVLGQVAGNHNGIFWTGNRHTEDYVLLYALGPGQDAFRGLMPNTRCFEIFTDFYRISHQNPQATEAEARLVADAAEHDELPHWA